MTKFKLDKENNEDLAKAIQELYINTRKVNSIAGNAKLCKERIPNQIELVKAELKETNKALKDNDLVDLVDGCADLLVTLSELLCLIDGNDALIKNSPKYLNAGSRNVAQLIGDINYEVDEGNWIDALGATEDLAAQLNADMVHNLGSVGNSNLSKFVKVTDLDDSEHTEFSIIEDIEDQGRYTDVYTEVNTYEGEEYLVFKTKYDQENNEKYPKGKFIKPKGFFKEPSIVVYE